MESGILRCNVQFRSQVVTWKSLFAQQAQENFRLEPGKSSRLTESAKNVRFDPDCFPGID
jgi:hypothetical protein